MEIGVSKNNIIRCLKLVELVFLLTLLLFICCIYRNHIIYESISVSVDEVAKVDYGTNDFNIIDHISGFEGDLINVVNDVDPNVLGNQEVVVEVTKSGVTKEIPILVNVVDEVSPSITINEEVISKTEGDAFDINSNISDILDNCDGNLEYVSNDTVTDENRNFYTYYSDSDINAVGTHNITIKAVDGSGNVTEKSFVYEVKEKPKPVTPAPATEQSTIQLRYDLPPNGSAGGIVGLAYSLVGSPYRSGGNSPAGFDCSGFVQYVYAQNGIAVSRSSNTQAYDGYAVPYSEAQPGDILSWGHGGAITHSALYVGNGMMIHATNPRQGVVQSSVAGWQSGSIDNLITVRRIS